MSDFQILAIPLGELERVRSSHTLRYVNDMRYDYALSQVALVPILLDEWAQTGPRLGEDDVQGIWERYANKRPGSEQGELNRTAKLTLDAFRGIYDIAALSTFGGVQVRYSAQADLAGVDLRVLLDSIGEIDVQLRVKNSTNDYLQLKRERRSRRGGLERTVYVATAMPYDLDTKYQPYVPHRYWYAQLPYRLWQEVLDKIAWDAA